MDNSGIFSFDKELLYLKGFESSIKNANLVIGYSMTACYFLSGCGVPLDVIWSDGEEERRNTVCRVMGRYATTGSGGAISKAICGPICGMPDKLSKLCLRIKNVVYVCPLIDGLPDLGLILLGKPEERSCKIPLFWPNKEELPGECQLFEEGLDGDGYGRMADLVSNGMMVLNDIMETPSEDAFYGRVLSFKAYGDPIYLLERGYASLAFPSENLFIREYAASSVPVEVNNTEKFTTDTGYSGDKVCIMVTSSYNQGMTDFFRFLRIMTGKSWVASSSPRDVGVTDIMPVFRNHGGYRLNSEEYERLYCA